MPEQLAAAGCVVAVTQPQTLRIGSRRVQFDAAPGVLADADRYERLFREALQAIPGSELRVLTAPSEVTPDAVLGHLRSTLARIRPGGLLLLAVVTHGDEVPDLTGEGETHDQVVVLQGGVLLDDDFAGLWAAHPHVDVVSFADICHADTALVYALPPDVEGRLRARGALLRLVDLGSATGVAPPHTAPGEPVRETVQVPRGAPRRLAFAASQKWELAAAGDDGGTFTRALMTAWRAQPTSYHQWFVTTAGLVRGQHPTLRYVGPDITLLEARPLTVPQ